MPNVKMIVNWVGDENNLQDRPSTLDVSILRNSQQYQTETITANEGWEHTWNYSGSYWSFTYTSRITTQLDRYNFSYEDSQEGSYYNITYVTTVTATYIPRPQPQEINISAEIIFYNDAEYKDWSRPTYVDLILKKDGEPIDFVRIGNGWNWNWVFENLDANSTYTIEAEQLENYNLSYQQDSNSWRIIYEGNYTPPTPPDPSPGNHPTKEDYDLMYSVLYDDISVDNALDIINILDYGVHKN